MFAPRVSIPVEYISRVLIASDVVPPATVLITTPINAAELSVSSVGIKSGTCSKHPARREVLIDLSRMCDFTVIEIWIDWKCPPVVVTARVDIVLPFWSDFICLKALSGFCDQRN